MLQGAATCDMAHGIHTKHASRLAACKYWHVRVLLSGPPPSDPHAQPSAAPCTAVRGPRTYQSHPPMRQDTVPSQLPHTAQHCAAPVTTPPAAYLAPIHGPATHSAPPAPGKGTAQEACKPKKRCVRMQLRRLVQCQMATSAASLTLSVPTLLLKALSTIW